MKLLLAIIFFLPLTAFCQHDTAVYRLYKNRQALEYRLNKEIINKKLSMPLSDSTEDEWDDAFFALQYLNRKDPWSDGRIRLAVADIQNRSYGFARSLLELLYGRYPGEFKKEISSYLGGIQDEKVWAMAAEYLLKGASASDRKNLENQVKEKLVQNPNSPFFISFSENFNRIYFAAADFSDFFHKNYLPGNVLMISIQRKNRDHPGLVVVRDSTGNFVKDSSGALFHVPQLARSLSGLPGYLTNGNSPSGILRMDGFDVSKAGAIGPTQNVQLTLPLEFITQHFLRDSTRADSVLKFTDYRQLLPVNLRNHTSLFEAFYAGMAGRHEIIAHGTTVKPEYYLGKSYYPFTPTLGCLCTYETWNDDDQSRQASDQQRLVDALKKAGGPNGYAIIFNIDDSEVPVSVEDLLPLLRNAGNE